MRIVGIGAACVCVVALLSPSVVPACDICSVLGGARLRWEVEQARLVVFGGIVNAKLGPDGVTGTSDLRVEAVIKSDPSVKPRDTIPLSRYVPPAPNLRFLVFLDVFNGQFDAYRSIVFTSDRIVLYLQGIPKQDKDDPSLDQSRRLVYFFDFLNDSDGEIAADAYKEWAAATNQEVGAVAPQLSAEKLRRWLADPKTPSRNLGLYGYLLGACGTTADAAFLRNLVANLDGRTAPALDGLLAGYIHLRPPEGWTLARELASRKETPFTQRHALLRMMRFLMGAEGDRFRAEVVACAGLLLGHEDMIDLVADALRHWRMWDHSARVLSHYDGAPPVAPITKRAIIRYALSCPQPDALAFVAARRPKEAALFQDVEEALQIESAGR